MTFLILPACLLICGVFGLIRGNAPRYEEACEQELWTPLSVEIKTPSGTQCRLDGFCLDLGEKGPIYRGSGCGLLNIHYAQKPARFTRTQPVDTDSTFKEMIRLREVYERKRMRIKEELEAGGAAADQVKGEEAKMDENNTNDLLYTHFGAMSPHRLFYDALADFYFSLHYKPEKLQITGGRSEWVIAEDSEEDNPLNLNIFFPRDKHSGGGCPVMVFVHGGSFNFGSSSLFGIHGTLTQFVRHGVIVVTVQYRLGPFGFLNMDEHGRLVDEGEENVPYIATPRCSDSAALNLGLEDQLLAVKWVKKHIRFFGGDPNRITLAGQSSGASSVAMLTLELFRRPIGEEGPLFSQLLLMSGTANLMAKEARQGKDIRAAFVKELLRSRSTSKGSKPHEEASGSDLWEILMQSSTKEILRADIAANPLGWDFEIHPNTCEGAMEPRWFDTLPRELFKQQTQYLHTKILMTTTKDEWATIDAKVRKNIPTLRDGSPIFSLHNKDYAYIPFLYFMQPFLTRYGHHWYLPLPMWLQVMAAKLHKRVADTRLSIYAESSVQSTANMDVHRRVFSPVKWFEAAWKLYEAELEQSMRHYHQRNQKHIEEFGFDKFKHFYIYQQLMSDWMFVLPTTMDAMRFAERNQFAEAVPDPNQLHPDIVGHGADLQSLFMMPLYWVTADCAPKCNEQYFGAAAFLSRILLSFVKGAEESVDNSLPPGAKLFHDEKGRLVYDGDASGVAKLPYMAIGTSSVVLNEDGYMSAERLAFWRGLFVEFGEPPFADQLGKPITFAEKRREATRAGTYLKRLGSTWASRVMHGLIWRKPELIQLLVRHFLMGRVGN